MIAAKNTADDQAKAQGVKRVREMLEGFLPAEERDEDDGGSAPFGNCLLYTSPSPRDS